MGWHPFCLQEHHGLLLLQQATPQGAQYELYKLFLHIFEAVCQ